MLVSYKAGLSGQFFPHPFPGTAGRLAIEPHSSHAYCGVQKAKASSQDLTRWQNGDLKGKHCFCFIQVSYKYTNNKMKASKRHFNGKNLSTLAQRKAPLVLSCRQRWESLRLLAILHLSNTTDMGTGHLYSLGNLLILKYVFLGTQTKKNPVKTSIWLSCDVSYVGQVQVQLSSKSTPAGIFLLE